MSFESHKQKIITFYKRHKRMPGYKEVMGMLGFKSKNAVFKLVNKLVEQGVVDKDSTGRMIPKNLAGEVPLLGLVEAGIPSVAEAGTLDSLNIDDYLVGQAKGETFLLEIKGDSMIEEGIHEGDLVIAERCMNPSGVKDGEIVIAEIDGGWTCKYLRKKGSRIYLEPANKNYKPIYPEQDLRIAAIVKGVIRKY